MAYKEISPIIVAEGGTGAQTFTSHGVLLGNTTSAITATTAGTTGQILTGVTGSAPTFQAPAASSITLTGDSGGGLTGNSFTITGGTSGATFAGAGTTLTESFNFLALPTTTSTNGQILINSSRVLHTYGTDNTFVGASAGNFTLTTGSSLANVALGSRGPLSALTTGASNVAIGDSAGSTIHSGSNNTIVGQNAGAGINTASNNTLLGFSVGASITGGSNTGVGYNSLGSLTSGTNNVCLGYSSGSAYTSSETNNLILGYNIAGTAAESNVIRIGNSSHTKCFITGIDGVNVGSVAKVLTEASNQLGTATITAGSNITVTPTANTITIASSAPSSGVSFLANKTSNQTISASTTSTVTFDTAVYNNGTPYSTGTNTFTAPSTALYWINVTLNATNASVSDSIAIVVNGTAKASGDNAAVALTSNTVSISIVLSLTASDAITVTYTNASGATNATVLGQSSPYESFFQAYKLS